MFFFSKNKVKRRLEKIKKIDHFYAKTKTWYDTDLSEAQCDELKSYILTFRFTQSEQSNLEEFIKRSIQEKHFSFSALCDHDKYLYYIKEVLIKNASQHINFFEKIKAIIRPFIQNELTKFIRNDDDVIRMMSIFFFYIVYSIYPLVCQSYPTKSIIEKMKHMISIFLTIPNENYQFAIMCYLLIDKYMDDDISHVKEDNQTENKDSRKRFLFFCHRTFLHKSCHIPSESVANPDYIAFQYYFNAFLSIYDVKTYDYLYDFMIYLFESLHRTSKRQNGTSGIEEETIYKETFSKSYLTIYFFILMSNLKLKKQKSDVITKNAKRAFMIQCYDDICDIHQDRKNKIETLYTLPKSSVELEAKIQRIFEKTKYEIYQLLHKEEPLLCSIWIYILLHIETFLVYKNRKYLSETFLQTFFQNKYYKPEVFDLLQIDLFSSTTILLKLLHKWISS